MIAFYQDIKDSSSTLATIMLDKIGRIRPPGILLCKTCIYFVQSHGTKFDIGARQMQRRLYQIKPRDKSPNPLLPNTNSFTESRQSYRSASYKEVLIHRRNPRVPNREIVLRYLVEFDIESIRAIWRRIGTNLRKEGLTYTASVELTNGKDGRPNNCVHYHILFDTTLCLGELREKIKAVCLKSGLCDKEFSLIGQDIMDWGDEKIGYFTKNSRWETVNMFEKGLSCLSEGGCRTLL